MDSNNNATITTADEYEKQREERRKWMDQLPEAFGIRDMVKKSKYRRCTAESVVWGIGTSAAIYLHRLRMGSSLFFSTNAAFFSLNLVVLSSYYVCKKKRDHEEETIAEMMKYNRFLPMKDMPPEIPLDENHPFFRPKTSDDDNIMNDFDEYDIDTATTTTSSPAVTTYEATVPKRKEWQPAIPPIDPAELFKIPTKPDKKE
jgi:hypothetical protein